MADTVIDNPILNRPYDEPGRHFEFDTDGITDRRRPSSYFVPVEVRTAYDLSATPFFLRGSGYREGTLFPWVVSDFSLIDAIESGIVEIPRMPVDDNQVSRTVTYLDLWSEIRGQLPKGGRRGQVAHDPTQMPDVLASALLALYGAGKVAVKVINHYGDEVLEVFPIGARLDDG